jgi:hypothetical protein
MDSYILFSLPGNRDPRTTSDFLEIVVPVSLSWFPIIVCSLLVIGFGLAKKWMIPSMAGQPLPLIWLAIGIIASFFVGSVFMVCNIAGLIFPLRNPDIYLVEPASVQIPGPLTTYEQSLADLKRMSNESDREYAIRANQIIHSGMIHYWWETGLDSFRIRIPVWENWLLYLRSYSCDSRYTKYQFADPRKALERGVGMCGQKSTALVGFLREEGIDAHIIGLEGHGLVTVELERDSSALLDPDYGVYIPMGIDEIRSKPDLIPIYYDSGVRRLVPDPNRRQQSIALIRDIFLKQTAWIDPTGFSLYLGLDVIKFEQLSYKLKWIVPILLMVPGILLFVVLHRSGSTFALGVKARLDEP